MQKKLSSVQIIIIIHRKKMKTIKKGTKESALVFELKKLLNANLGTSLDVGNSNFGDETERIVKQFQKSRGLIQDGIVGPVTWKELRKESTCAVSEGSELSRKAIEVLATQVGVKEATGKNDGVEVESYLKAVGLGKGYAWCQAFMFWGFLRAANALGVDNPLPKTAGVLNSWNNSKAYQVPKGEKPKPGDVFVMDFGKGAGHTGIVTDVVGDTIYTIEGNTSADPKLPTEDREGQGVFRRSRKISSINKGFLRY